MSPKTLTTGLIPWRRAASAGKPSCRAVRLSGADDPLMSHTRVRRRIIAPVAGELEAGTKGAHRNEGSNA